MWERQSNAVLRIAKKMEDRRFRCNQDDDLRPSKKDFPRPTANKAASRILIGSCQSSNGRETEPAEQSSSAEQVASKM
jgi:hypothetical protein